VTGGVPALRVVVVDDEEPARRLLGEYLAEHPEVEVVGACGNGFEAVKAVAELHPDLLLLDIRMPKLDGFEVLELIGDDVAVVFTTAYDEYAVRAFEVHAVDYLLKPFSAQRLSEALERVRAHAGRKAEPTDAEALARAAGRRPDLLDRVLVRDGGQVHVIPIDELDYVEARDDDVLFHVGRAVHRKQQTMAFLESRLDPRRFVRIHRTFILNLDRLARIELYAKDSRIAILKDGTRLPLSRAGYARLRELL
jgi:two-component system LytT family response regulator